MSDHDVLWDAIERLEWDEARDAKRTGENPETKWHQVTRRAALTGGAAGIAALALQACGGSSSSSSSSSSSAHQFGSGGRWWLKRGDHLRRRRRWLQVHAGQPRHHQPVLHPDPERCRRRLQVARLLLPVDRLAEPRSSARWSTRSTARSAPAWTVSASRSGPASRRSTPRVEKALALEDSRSSPTTPTRPATPGSPTSVRTCSCPARRWASTSRSLVPSGDVALFIATPGLAEHPAAHRRSPAPPWRRELGDQDPRGRDRRRSFRRSCPRLTPTPPRIPAPRACSRSTAAARRNLSPR